MEKFGKYLQTLASLSNFIRVKYNETNTQLEIHGKPEEKAMIMNFFAEIDD